MVYQAVKVVGHYAFDDLDKAMSDPKWEHPYILELTQHFQDLTTACETNRAAHANYYTTETGTTARYLEKEGVLDLNAADLRKNCESITHGIMKDAPTDNVCAKYDAWIKCVKTFRADQTISPGATPAASSPSAR